MSHNLETLITVAAELRAAGHTWDGVARKVHRKAKTVQKWPNRRPDDWETAYRAAQLRRFDEVHNEAGAHLLGLLRDPDPKVKAEAVKLWMRAVPAAVARHRELVGTGRPAHNPIGRPTVSYQDYLAHRRAQLDRWRAEAGLPPATDEQFRIWYRQPSEGWHEVKCDDLGNILPPAAVPGAGSPPGSATAVGIALLAVTLVAFGRPERTPEPAAVWPARSANIVIRDAGDETMPIRSLSVRDSPTLTARSCGGPVGGGMPRLASASAAAPACRPDGAPMLRLHPHMNGGSAEAERGNRHPDVNARVQSAVAHAEHPDLMDRPKSHAAFARAKQLIPGGVNSPARAFGAVGGEPVFIARGEGAYLFDVDGNRYIDFIGSWGPMILGHAHPRVVEAAVEAARNGSSFGAPTERESELADLIRQAMPAVEMVRMVSSGTEAAMSAVRLARGFTGRDLIVKFAGCYHGHVDSLLVSAGSSALTHGVPTSPGVPAGCTNDTVVLRYNDVNGLRDLFKTRGDQVAGVMLEPVVGNMGLVTPTPEFRAELRRLTRHHGALLVYDEVMTGFRLSYGGAQGLFGDTPDLTILGKIVGGGYPVGAYGGREDIMRKVMPAGPVFQAGTLSGNPVAMAAGIATMRELKDNPPYDRLELLSRELEDGLRAAATEARVPHQVNRVGSMWTLFFTGTPVVDLDTAKTSDTALFARFFWAMMDRDIYLPCSQFEAAFTSAAHSDLDIAAMVAAAREALQVPT